ncbi:unnamed protein product [Arctogadus glacialis]
MAGGLVSKEVGRQADTDDTHRIRNATYSIVRAPSVSGLHVSIPGQSGMLVKTGPAGRWVTPLTAEDGGSTSKEGKDEESNSGAERETALSASEESVSVRQVITVNMNNNRGFELRGWPGARPPDGPVRRPATRRAGPAPRHPTGRSGARPPDGPVRRPATRRAGPAPGHPTGRSAGSPCHPTWPVLAPVTRRCAFRSPGTPYGPFRCPTALLKGKDPERGGRPERCAPGVRPPSDGQTLPDRPLLRHGSLARGDVTLAPRHR